MPTTVPAVRTNATANKAFVGPKTATGAVFGRVSMRLRYAAWFAAAFLGVTSLALTLVDTEEHVLPRTNSQHSIVDTPSLVAASNLFSAPQSELDRRSSSQHEDMAASDNEPRLDSVHGTATAPAAAVDGLTFGEEWFGDGEARCMMQGYYKNGKQHGIWRTYNPQGYLWQEYSYRDGLLDGQMTTWNTDSEAIAEVCFYSRGQLHGTNRTWHSNGQEAMVQEFVKGKLSGAATGWYANGHLRYKVHYAHGLFSGECRFYNANDELERERSGLFESGKKVADCQD